MTAAGTNRVVVPHLWFVAFAIIVPISYCCGLPPNDTESSSGACKAVWTKGIGLIRAGHIAQGISLLDSIRVSGFENDVFLKDYAAHVFHALVPEKSALQSVIFDAHAPDDHILDTFAPVSYEWKIDRSDAPSGARKPPCFTYGATFEVRKPFHLVFTGLAGPGALALTPGSMPNALVLKSIKDYFSQRKEKALCKLFIDFAAQKIPLFDYLCPRLSGRYDSVAVMPDVPAGSGISLRCYSLPRIQIEDAKYTAIASFDRPVPGQQKGHAAAFPAAGAQVIRFTVVVQSPADVKDITEAKFQSLIRAFL